MRPLHLIPVGVHPHPLRGSPGLFAALALLLGALTACADVPVVPESDEESAYPAPGGAPVASSAPGTVIATRLLPAQPDPSGLPGRFHREMVSPSRPGWYRVRIEGELTVGSNPEYAEVCPDKRAHCPPAPPSYGRSVGPGGILEGSGYPENGVERRLAFTEAGARAKYYSSHSTPLSAGEFLVWVPPRGTIRLFRTPIPYRYCWERCWYAYTVEGSQTMTVTAAASPVEVKATPVEGGSVRFEVTANAYNLNAPGTYWRYAEGDVRANPEWFGAYYRAWNFRYFNQFQDRIRECDGQTTCTYRPSKPGRMYVQTALKNDDGSWVASHAVTPSAVIGANRIVLECNGDLGANHVTRGREITCQAKKDPSNAPGDLAITGWSFDGKPRSDGELASDKWVGVMAQGGTVEVKGRIGGGTEQPARAVIQVKGREWRGKIPYPNELPQYFIDPGRFPDLPVKESNGYDVWIDGGLGVYEYDLSWRGHFDPIQSGPNKGWWYFKTPPQWDTPEVYIGPFLEPGHPFYEAQTGRRPGDKNPPRGYTGWCTKADMDKLRQEVLDHEGAIPGPRLSHHEFNVDYVANNDPGPAVEAVAFYLVDSSANFRDVAEAEMGKAYEDQFTASNNAAVHAESNLYTVPCKVHYP